MSDQLSHDRFDAAIIPRSAEAEQAVLGALLLDASAWDSVADLLNTPDFFEGRHQLIFSAIGSMASACKPVDVISTFEHLKAAGTKDDEYGGLAYLGALSQSVGGASRARRHAEIVRERSLQRALMSAADQAMDIARDAGPVADKSDRILSLFDRLQRAQMLHAPRLASALVVQRLDHYTAQAEGAEPTGAPTGIAQLDEALNGGLQAGRVYVLAARPSVGKTSLAMQIALHRAKAGDGVLLLSQEMPAEECIDRAICNLGAVDYGRLQRAKMDDLDWRGTSDAVEMLARLPLWIDDQAGLTLREIRAKALGLRREGLKLLIVDYLQLCSGSNPGRGVTRNSELEEICRGLKTLAKQQRLAVLMLSQLSREVEKRASPRPNLGDLRDSGAIEQDADVVLFLWFFRQWSDRKVMGLGVAKNRQGKNGQDIALEFIGEHQRWLDSHADISERTERARSKEGAFE